MTLNTCFKNLFRKTVKNCWFYSFKQATRTLQATLNPTDFTFNKNSKNVLRYRSYFYFLHIVEKTIFQ